MFTNPLRVLIVDDDYDTAISFKRLLDCREEARFVTYVAHSLRETVQKLQPLDSIDAVLLDMHLPDAPSGPELITIVKALRPELRVIVVTGWDVDEEVVMAAGADALIKKPACPADVVRQLRYNIAFARSEKERTEMDAILSKFGRAMAEVSHVTASRE